MASSLEGIRSWGLGRFEASGTVVDVLNETMFQGTIEVSGGRVVRVKKGGPERPFIMPGFVDAHVHIESSLLTPSEYARTVLPHGTVSAVCDPHEIANVLGVKGVRYMIEESRGAHLKLYFGAPSCVPATRFETTGAEITFREVKELFKMGVVKSLAEVMDVPAVLRRDPAIMSKIRVARRFGRPVDGHAPGLRGSRLARYIRAGISTDHESLDMEEAAEKLSFGMRIMIRGGSLSKDLDSFLPLAAEHPDRCMFCSDDLHPDDLLRGHIDVMVKQALSLGLDEMRVLRCACVNPVLHYGLEVGLIREGDPADFIIVKNLRDLDMIRTYINGIAVAEAGKPLMPHRASRKINNFAARKKRPSDFKVASMGGLLNAIGVADGTLITRLCRESAETVGGGASSGPKKDLVKIAVVNRYREAPPVVGFVKNFGIKRGALASSVAHDSHNIVGVGVTDEELCEAVNLVIEHQGGLSLVFQGERLILPLPVAGLMTDGEGPETAERYSRLNRLAREKLGSGLTSPFMTLSFMSLLVIPEIKISDRGLFDVRRQRIIGLFEPVDPMLGEA
ncbi:MAG: adenine deaminase [Candidatus Bathyarchaeia archaeon]